MNPDTRIIRVALAGNPNSGKTSVFNLLTGMQQQVGNWPGVTVERKVGRVQYAGYRFEVIDLPGTYSLTSYSIEERVAREYILEERPDVIINVVDAANLERNLYLTTQLLEMGADLIVDLNMWDEYTASGAQLDIERFGALLGTPVATSIGHRGRGREELLAAVIRIVEGRSERHRHVPISIGTQVENVIQRLTRRIDETAGGGLWIPSRYLATKLLEGDPHMVEVVHNRLPDLKPILVEAEAARAHVQHATGMEPSRVISEGRYGFIDGLLRETQRRRPLDRMRLSRELDSILTHRYLGLPIFILFMWVLFNGTFTLGAYPMAWIEQLMDALGGLVTSVMPAGWLRDLMVEGVIGGVGAVATFLPNIMILFLGIALLEDTGYMARIAFIMDRVMHLFGLHGKSFIPMLTGFGCTVPAIMATRSLESHRDRVLTSLLIPHMSCSARLPVYVLLAGAFFGAQAGNVVLSIYLLGVLVALGVGAIFSRTLLKADQVGFVMELPPYRWPTLRGLLTHMWARSRHYLRKMGGVILVASIVLWVLGAFPRHPQAGRIAARAERIDPATATPAQIAAVQAEQSEVLEYSIIGRMGRAIEPVLTPLGFDWRMGVSLVSGFVAKEVVVSTLGVLYQAGEQIGGASTGLRQALADPRSGFSPLVALAFMVFVLLYTPCVAAILTLRRELGTRWMWFDIGYQLLLAWTAALLVTQGGRLLGLA